MYKIWAVIIILAISLYLGYIIKKEGKVRIECCEAVMNMFSYIRCQIKYYCTPTDKLFCDYENGFLEENGIITLLKNNRWDEVVCKISTVDKNLEPVIHNFFNKFGKSSSEEQIANCDYSLDELETIIAEYKSELPKKYSAYSSLALIFGIMVAILLI